MVVLGILRQCGQVRSDLLVRVRPKVGRRNLECFLNIKPGYFKIVPLVPQLWHSISSAAHQ